MISRCSTKIARRSDGLHALPFCDTSVWPAVTATMFWKGTETPAISPLPIENFMASSEALAEWLGQDTLLVCDQTGSAMRISEISYPALQLKKQWTYGDAQSRWGMSCPTSDGGVAFAVWAEAIAGQDNQLWIDLAYCSPDGSHWSQRFKLPPSLVPQLNAPKPHNLALAQGSDGLLYVFCTRDSAGKISKTRFQRGPGASWVLKDNVPYWLNDDVQGEIPRITAALDPFHNRIILGYQSFEFTWMEACQKTIVSKVMLTAVYPDQHYEKLAKSAWWSSHPWYPPIIPWPRQDGIYVMSQVFRDDCSISLRPAKLLYSNPGVLIPGTDFGFRVAAFGDDGWCLVENQDGSKTLNLTALPATAPAAAPVKVRFYQQKAVFNYGTVQPSDEVEYSLDGGRSWLNAPLPDASPLTVTVAEGAVISLRLSRS